MTATDKSLGCEIPLSGGHVAIVDAEDYQFLMQWKWYARLARGHVYATRSQHIQLEPKKRVQKPVNMHAVLLPPPAGFVVDHINGNGLDNRKENLRLCKQQQNTWNRKPVTGSSSKFKGVSFQAATQYWKAYIKTNDKQKHLGCYRDEEDAARAYNKAAKELHGDFAVLNPVEDGVCHSQIIR